MSLESVFATPPPLVGLGGDHDDIKDWIGDKERYTNQNEAGTKSNPAVVAQQQYGSDDDTDEYEYTQPNEQAAGTTQAPSSGSHPESDIQKQDTLPMNEEGGQNEEDHTECMQDDGSKPARKSRRKGSKPRGRHHHSKRRRSPRGRNAGLESKGSNSGPADVDSSPDLMSEGGCRVGADAEAGLEDGELEDGEIDEEEGGDAPTKTQPKHNKQKASHDGAAGSDVGPPGGDGESSDSLDEEEQALRDHRKWKREKNRKKKEDKKKRKRIKRAGRYVDHDNQNEYSSAMSGSWSNFSKRSPPVAYDSAEEGDHRAHPAPRSYNSAPRAKHRRKERSPPGPYDSPYDSPPGPYDSPSDDDGYGPSKKQKRFDSEDINPNRSKPSMLSLVDDDYMDVNIAANEKQDIFQRQKPPPQQQQQGPPQRGQMTASQIKKAEKRKRYMEYQRQRMEHPPEPKPKLPCKFFMEGKCAKGSECTYSHDFEPPHKREVCKFYISDSCSKGANCLYMHKDYPCRYFHTGQKCYQGDNCKFSHEPLNEDTRIIVEKMKRGEDNPEIVESIEESMGSPIKKPSLLGSPPRLDQNRKIPSLFDIKVSPPSHIRPNQPPQQPPNPAAQHPRPGFYGEIGGSLARPSGPPPQRMMGPRQQGPPLRGGPPLLNHPNPRMPPMGHPNRPPLPRPRMGSFPPGMRPNMMPHGMGPPPQGNMPPRMPPNMGHQDSPMPPQQGLLGPHPGPMGPGPGNFRPQAPQSPFESTEVELEVPETKDEPTETVTDSAASGDSENERKQAGFDFPANLAPKQRELFMRIHQQQREANEDEPVQTSDDKDNAEDDNWYSSDEDDMASGQGGGQSDNLTKLFKSLSQQQQQQIAASSQSPSSSSGSVTTATSGSAAFNIVDMISAIKNQNKPGLPQNGQSASESTISRDPRHQTAVDPRSSAPPQMSADPRNANMQAQSSGDPRTANMSAVNPGDPRSNNIADPRSNNMGGPLRMNNAGDPRSNNMGGPRPNMHPGDPRFAGMPPHLRGDPRFGNMMHRPRTPFDHRRPPPPFNDPRMQGHFGGGGPHMRGPAPNDPRRQQHPPNDPRLNPGMPNIMQQSNSGDGGMSNDPRRQHQQNAGDNVSNDPRRQQFPASNDPRQKKTNDPRLAQTLPPTHHKEEAVEIDAAAGGPFPYNLRPFVCEANHKPAPPQNVDFNHKWFRNDPRLQKYLNRENSSTQGGGDGHSSPSSVGDPRGTRNSPADTHSGYQDPRIQRGLSNPGLTSGLHVKTKTDPDSSPVDSQTRSNVGLNVPSVTAMQRQHSAPPPSLPPLLQNPPPLAHKHSSDTPSPIQSPEPQAAAPPLLTSSMHSSLPPLLATRPPSLDRPKPSQPLSDPRLARQNSSSAASVVPPANNSDSENKPLLSHRSDPRFRKKLKAEPTPVSEVAVTAPNASKVGSSRRDNLEYSSPLGGAAPQQESGYNSGYNQHNHNKSVDNKGLPARVASLKQQVNGWEGSGRMDAGSVSPPGRSSPSAMAGGRGSPLMNHDIAQNHAMQAMPPPTHPPQTMPGQEEASLKDVFKTFDPTASPFC